MKNYLNKILTRKVMLITTALVATCAINTPSIAAKNSSWSQKCELGQTCPIPGNDGGQTTVKVMPSTGMRYRCEVTSEGGGSLKFAVKEGKDFKITHGNSIYNANPGATIQIDGRFEHPENPQAIGEIRFIKLPFSTDGTVTCNPVS